MTQATRIALAGLAGLLLLTANTALAEERVENHPFNAGQTLTLELRSGANVTVEGRDQSGIELSLNERRRSLDDFRIEVTPNNNGLRILTDLKRGNGGSSLQLSLKVPRNLNIEVESAGGNLQFSDVSGVFSGRTGGGSIELRQLSGRVDLRTGGGRMEVHDSTLDGELRTGGGKVLVSNVIGDLQARSGGGSVVYRNVRSASGDMRTPTGVANGQVDSQTVLINSAGGRIDIDHAPAGARVETGGGSIRVVGAERFIAANTGGGSIELQLGEGWVEANTGGGDIEVSVLRDIAGKGDIELTSGAGDITLTLPADFSMNADIELGVTRNAREEYTITSDFPLQIDESDDWDYGRGTPRKYIRATGSPGGGLHRLKIRTTNGNVVIRRAQG